MAELNLIPELRFPDFYDSWHLSIFSELVNVIDCKHRTPPYVEEGIPVVSPGTIKWGSLDLKAPTKKVSESEYELLMDHCDPSIGDLVFSRNQSIGIASIVSENERFVLGQDTVLISSRKVDSYFIYQRLQTREVQALIFALSGGSTFSRINLKDIRGLKLFIPNQDAEQQKIASFLTAIDEHIQLLQKKKVKLEEYKKGVMQKLFSQEIRFKDDRGNNFPDWEEKRLEEVVDYEQPTKYLVSHTEYRDEYNIPVLTAGKTFLLGYTNETDGVFEENLPTIIFDDFTTAFQFVDFPFKAKSSAMKMLVPKTENVNIRFVYEAMKTIKFPLAEHKRYWISEFQKEYIPFPSIEEQNYIVAFLSSLDKSIEMIEKEIEGTITFKKGLLQKMFV